MFRLFAIGIALSLIAALPAKAEDFETGLAAYDRGNYASALQEWRPLSVQGNAKAQHSLGVMYFYGEGVPQSYSEAMRWWHKAAAQGYAKAQFSIGAAYALGYGVPQNDDLAQKWLSLSAAKGNWNAIGLQDFLAKRSPSAQIAERQNLAR